ncbi:hypothetical protein P153DRAFT_315545, partial [Dothidotthia symphoricarpi CBS 119687]
MPPSMPAPSIRIPIELLTPTAFSQFGTVVENPAQAPSSKLPIPNRIPPPDAVNANQGSAVKYLDVTHMSNLYSLAPSKKPAKAVMNMFVCSPRDLRGHEPSESIPSSWGDLELDDDNDDDSHSRQLLDVGILERHPFTTQTFIPMGLSSQDKHTQYLVVVAPTLPASASRRNTGRPPPYPVPETQKRNSIRDIFSRARPALYANDLAAPPSSQIARLHPSARPKGPGLPDLKNLRAFVATGCQAVTYGAGTWHAPMVVIGDRPIDFVVVQFANQVGLEDCQEILLAPQGTAKEGIVVTVDSDSSGKVQIKAGVGSVRAKL